MAETEVLFHQENGKDPYVHSRYGEIKWFEVRTITTPALFYGLNPQRLLLVSKSEDMARRKETSNDETICQTNAYFEGLDKSYYLEGTKKLENCLTKYMELKEGYAEK